MGTSENSGVVQTVIFFAPQALSTVVPLIVPKKPCIFGKLTIFLEQNPNQVDCPLVIPNAMIWQWWKKSSPSR